MKGNPEIAHDRKNAVSRILETRVSQVKVGVCGICLIEKELVEVEFLDGRYWICRQCYEEGQEK